MEKNDATPLQRGVCNLSRRSGVSREGGRRGQSSPPESVPVSGVPGAPPSAPSETRRPRPPRLICPPLRPAARASSAVHSCAVPFSCAARPPLLAISRCFSGDIEANPRRSLRTPSTVLLLIPERSTPVTERRRRVPPALVPVAPGRERVGVRSGACPGRRPLDPFQASAWGRPGAHSRPLLLRARSRPVANEARERPTWTTSCMPAQPRGALFRHIETFQ